MTSPATVMTLANECLRTATDDVVQPYPTPSDAVLVGRRPANASAQTTHVHIYYAHLTYCWTLEGFNGVYSSSRLRLRPTERHQPRVITVLPVIRHRSTCAYLTPARQAGTRFTYPGGMEG